MLANAVKIVKHLPFPCPDCECHEMVVIVRNEEEEDENGITVVFSKRYEFCQLCEYEIPYKKDRKNQREEFEEE